MIKSTKNYGLFKLHRSNRKIVDTNLDKLVRSIQSRNLLFMRPILVNKEMQVIDGQHRLHAAEKLGVEIYYEIQENVAVSDMALLNAAQNAWGASDYLNFYANEGKEEYIKLKNFMDKHNMNLKNVMSLNFGLQARHRGGHSYKSFRNGEYIFPKGDELIEMNTRLSQLKEVQDFIRNKTIGQKQYIETTAFIIALASLFSAESFKFEVFMKKLTQKLDLISPRTKIISYIELFRQIYNFGSKNPIAIDNII